MLAASKRLSTHHLEQVNLSLDSLYVSAQSDIFNLAQLDVRKSARIAGPVSSPGRMNINVEGDLIVHNLGELRAASLELRARVLNISGQLQASATLCSSAHHMRSLLSACRVGKKASLVDR